MQAKHFKNQNKDKKEVRSVVRVVYSQNLDATQSIFWFLGWRLSLRLNELIFSHRKNEPNILLASLPLTESREAAQWAHD